MPNVYIFRGKAATGKTTITNLLSCKLNTAVLRKDDIFDSLSEFINNNGINNNATYNILAKLIQTDINNNSDIIVDIGLSNNNSFKQFLSKIKFENSNLFLFYCDCTDIDIWEKRFEERFKNPLPNQYFTSFDEVLSYYNKTQVELLENEYCIDSANSIDSIIKFVYTRIK